MQERAASPLKRIVHAPQTPCSQPTCVPVRPRSSRPAGEHLREVAAVVGGGVEVGVWRHELGGAPGRGGDRRVGEAVAFEDLLGRGQPHGHRPGSRRGQARLRAARAVADHHRRDRDDREVAAAPRELLERKAGRRVHRWQADLGEDLVGLEAGREVRHEEVLRLHDTLALRAARHHRAAERREDRGVLRGRVRVGDRAADRAARPDRQVPHPLRRLPEEREPSRDHGRELDRPLTRHRAEPHLPVALLDVGEARDPAEVHERGRTAQAEVKERHEALAPGEDFRLAAVALEQRHGRLQARRGVVVERDGLHA